MDDCNVTCDEEARTIFFSDEVTNASALALISFMSSLYEQDNEAPILIAVDSLGGDCYEAITVGEFMRFLPVDINTVCFGHAFSAGFYIFMCGDNRFVTQNAVLMYHSIVLSISDLSMKPDAMSLELSESFKLQEIMDKQIIDNASSGIDKKMNEIKNAGTNWYIRKEEMKKYHLCKIMGDKNCSQIMKKKSKKKD